MKHDMVYSVMSIRVISALLITVGLLYFSFPVRSLAGQSDGIVEKSCGEENVNGKKVLIAYDSKHGSTSLVASQIADVLCICGYQVDISRARKIEDVTLYDAVVAGSPIYWAKFLPGTQLFLKNHEQTLATMPVALFALSTYADEETGLVRDEVKGFFVDKELEKVPGINPLGEIGLFGGTFTLRTLFPVEAFSMKLENYSDSNYLNEEVVITWAQNLCILFE